MFLYSFSFCLFLLSLHPFLHTSLDSLSLSLSLSLSWCLSKLRTIFLSVSLSVSLTLSLFPSLHSSHLSRKRGVNVHHRTASVWIAAKTTITTKGEYAGFFYQMVYKITLRACEFLYKKLYFFRVIFNM